MIVCSLGEVEAYARRAARGAGMSWGLAEEAAKATRWLAARSLPGLELLLRLLTLNDGRPYEHMAPSVDESPWRARHGDLCPICCGAALSDRGDDAGAFRSGIVLVNLDMPLLLTPFLDRLNAGPAEQVALTLPDSRIVVSGGGVTLLDADGPRAVTDHADEARVILEPSRHRAPRYRPGATRVSTERSVWRALDDLGKRTYVPASAASRARGAGAGRIDND